MNYHIQHGQHSHSGLPYKVSPSGVITFCYDERAKSARSRAMKGFYREAARRLPSTWVWKTHFNPGGIAVWGETYAKVYRTPSEPILEAYDTGGGILIRQWDGRSSGRNHYALSMEQFCFLAEKLAGEVFKRF